MRFLAILRDSVRETIDTKVFYVLVALSCLVIFFVAGLGFVPESAEQGVKAITKNFVGAARTSWERSEPPVHYEVSDFEQLNDIHRPWEGEYRFVLTAQDDRDLPRAFRMFVYMTSLQRDEKKLSDQDRETRIRLFQFGEEAKSLPPHKLKEKAEEWLLRETARVTPEQMEQFMKEQFVTHGTLETTRITVRSAEPTSIEFVIEARGKPDTFRTWPHKLSFAYGNLPTEITYPVGHAVFEIEQGIVGSSGAGVTMLIATIVTAFFIPNMLRKGSIDLLLAKPIYRATLLIYKYVGGLSFMFLNTTVIVLGVWLSMGVRTGLWSTGFLAVIVILTFQFAILYSVSTLFGVLTRSAIVAILATCFAWSFLFMVGHSFMVVEATREMKLFPEWANAIVDTIHFVTPRYKDFDALTEHLMAQDLLAGDNPRRQAMDKAYANIRWGESIGVSVAFIACMLGLACVRFAYKDY